MRFPPVWSAITLAALLACNGPTSSEPPPTDTNQLATRLDELRQRYGIPGLSAAISCDGTVRWSAGFGMADVGDGTPAAPETVFHVASITKTFASIVLLQLVAEGSVALDDPVSDYGIQFPSDVRVRHLLSHTSDLPPGTGFRYDGNRYALLDSVVRHADGRSFGEAVVQRVIVPAGLMRTAPSSLASESVRAALAQGYDGGGDTVAYPTYVGTAAGLLSTVLDLVAYASAIDAGELYPPGSRDLAFTAARTTAGAELPYGLGWFVDERQAGKVVWHFGSWIGNSSLLILAPEQGAAFALLANSDRLSTPFPMASGALESSSFAEAFLGWLEQGEGCGP